ncbi:MAG: hypothetical protein HYW98_00315 [Candidatus Wildermuthbacteria bacterium]|nr:hypothetical protein [Candidatus Wildermuthbacteria bacterium]
MNTIARSSIICIFFLATLGCALLYAGIPFQQGMDHGACAFSMRQEPCVQQGNLLNFSAMHFAVFSSVQGAIAIGAFLLFALFLIAIRISGVLMALQPCERGKQEGARVRPITQRFLRWFSLFEKRDPEGDIVGVSGNNSFSIL